MADLMPIVTLSPNMSPMDLLGVENGPNTLTLQLRFKQLQMFSNFCHLYTSLPSHDLVVFLHSWLYQQEENARNTLPKFA